MARGRCLEHMIIVRILLMEVMAVNTATGVQGQCADVDQSRQASVVHVLVQQHSLGHSEYCAKSWAGWWCSAACLVVRSA